MDDTEARLRARKERVRVRVCQQKNQTMLCISDDDVGAAAVEKMLEEGNLVYEGILDAFSDV